MGLHDQTRPNVIHLFSCSTSEHEISIAHKNNNNKMKIAAFKPPMRYFFIKFTNVYMPTIVGILTFMSKINSMLS